MLHTYARTHLGVPRLGLPYTIGFVDVPEGIRLFGLILLADGEAIEIGQRMNIVIDTLWTDPSGEQVLCYKFRPAKAGLRP
jgi:uncharacterized OB-fold protein